MTYNGVDFSEVGVREGNASFGIVEIPRSQEIVHQGLNVEPNDRSVWSNELEAALLADGNHHDRVNGVQLHFLGRDDIS